MTAPYDGLPERWEPYAPTPEPEREHVEIRTFGSDRCLCPVHVEQYEAERRAEQARRAIPQRAHVGVDPLLTALDSSHVALVKRIMEEQAAEVARLARELRPLISGLPIDSGRLQPTAPPRGNDVPRPRKPPGDDPRAGRPVPPIWNDDDTVTLWHPDSPGLRVTVHPRLVRRLLRGWGLRTSPFATSGEIARERRHRARTAPRARYDATGLLHAVCHQCDDRSHPSARNVVTSWADAHTSITGHHRIAITPVHPPHGPGGGSPRIPTTRGRR